MYPEFFQYVGHCEIFALFETHVVEEKIDQWTKYFKDFDLFWKPAKRSSRYGRASGGCVYGIKKCVRKKGIKYVFSTENGIDIIRVESKEKKLCIIPLYIRGEDWNKEFEEVKDFFREATDTNIIMVGDVNVRIGNIQQDLDESYKTNFIAGFGSRKSKDEVVNARGRSFMEFNDNYGLIVLNGRTRGDEDGNYTFISTVGNSVNDICATSLEALECIDKFEVESKIWSDHMPLKISLNFTQETVDNNVMNLLPKLIWKDSEKERYVLKLNQNLSLQKTQGNIRNLNDLVAVIKNSTKAQKQLNINKNNFKSIWFNGECSKARKQSFEMLHVFRSTNNPQDKDNYLQAKRSYRKICEKSKKEHNLEMERKINGAYDAKDWWKVAKQIRGQSFQVGVQITAYDFMNYFNTLLNPEQMSHSILYAPMLKADQELDKEISTEEIVEILNKTKTNKAPGVDRVPYEFLKNASQEFYSELANIYNIIFETGKVDETFVETVIFPIFKKGNANLPNNYRGISFMNCVAKVLMGILNSRIQKWVEKYNILNEFQAGFRPKYSTIDNVYNLASIVHLKFNEKKKVYAFFVDFKAAFDKVPRQLLIYKLHNIGLSTKMVNLIENIYANTRSAVWTGNEVSEYFNTYSGVRQGCLLSPLLFTLYLNDLHNNLEGGLMIGDLNVRVLLYADDIVLLADNVDTMKKMIVNLENYCDMWSMEVNLTKSEMVVFRKGGKLSRQENFVYKGQQVKIVNEYCYLGVILTTKMSFAKHLDKRNSLSKCSINATWKSFLNKSSISLASKWRLFQAVCRSIQSYGAQIWGGTQFDDVDKLQRYFIKRILKLPDFTPNYTLSLETRAEDNHFYTLNLHINYIFNTIFQYSDARLPHKLSLLVLNANVFWAKQLNDLGNDLNIYFDEHMDRQEWIRRGAALLQELKDKSYNTNKEKALSSNTRFYRLLNHNKGDDYINRMVNQNKISLIFKTRCDILPLNANNFRIDNRTCSLCNMREDETLQHFMAKCPILKEFRVKYFGKTIIEENELINILNGDFYDGWNRLFNYVTSALKYRNNILNEFI